MTRSTRILAALMFAFCTTPLLAQVSDTYVIPAAAKLAGGFGTNWKTRISIFNPQLDRTLDVHIVFLPTLGATDASVTATATVPANAIAASNDILADLGAPVTSGALLLYTDAGTDPLARAFLVTSDTYNDTGRDGTYGQTIPGLFKTGLQDDGITGIVHGVSNNDANGWRTNIGAVNLGRCNADLLVSVYDVDGNTLLRRVPMTLPPLGHYQQRLPVSVDSGSVELEVHDPCVADVAKRAIVFAYSSTVDQLSGDPAYQSPVLLAPASDLYTAKAAARAGVGAVITNAQARAIGASARNLGALKLTTTRRELR